MTAIALHPLIALSGWEGHSDGPDGSEVGIESGGGGGAVFTKTTIPVYFYGNPEWIPYVQDAYRQLSAAMPKRGPRFQVRVRDQKPCGEVRQDDHPNQSIAICSVPGLLGSDGQYLGWTAAVATRHTLNFVKVLYSDHALSGWAENITCHEGMHSISWVNDNYGAEDASCVQGYLDAPGAWDMAYLKKVYAKHDTKQGKKHRKHHRHQHKNQRRHH